MLLDKILGYSFDGWYSIASSLAYLCVLRVIETYAEDNFVFNGFVQSGRVEIACTNNSIGFVKTNCNKQVINIITLVAFLISFLIYCVTIFSLAFAQG